MPNDIAAFEKKVADNIKKLGAREDLQAMGVDFIRRAGEAGYSYNFKWMGVPIIQFPQDLIAMQELIWKIQPDIIVETGVARGGSLLFYSSLLSMIGKNDGKVIGIDIDIRPHNRETIEQHPYGSKVHLVSGSSVNPHTFKQVEDLCGHGKTVLVCLDSLHTHDHVLQEMRLYSKLVSKDSYLVVFDTVIEELPNDYYPDRPWSHGNNPMTAVWAYLKEDDSFVIDEDIPNKILITVARNGFLKKSKMSKFQVTGATGYIGTHFVRAALARGHDVELIVRRPVPESLFTSSDRSRLTIQHVNTLIDTACDPQAKLVHLAWDNVGAYKDISLVSRTLPEQLDFLIHMIDAGCRDITVAGTCLEYGLHEGAINEETPCTPVTLYGLAKYTLFSTLTLHTAKIADLHLKWLRYFYIYGEGQRKASLFGQLSRAISEQQDEFPMSPGDQQRDFIDVRTAAHNSLMVADQNKVTGAINIGNGYGTSVIAQATKLKDNAPIRFKTGVYPYPDYEPFAFWADVSKLKTVDGVQIDEKDM